MKPLDIDGLVGKAWMSCLLPSRSLLLSAGTHSVVLGKLADKAVREK